MGKSCKGIRAELIACLIGTPCGQNGGSPKECLHGHPEAAAACDQLRKMYFECRRGNLDMRKRIRGIDGY
ncbi:mitochondrial CIV assembly protein Coa5/Pet191 [Andalucia godoyi]|uniref:Mitochondrial CIV assembly protein Coa5/Pet191 n=1 Tax=Andalucia godoyi TaxID=505711 RepID=A0A8K0F2D8_ANDGO|nr:mitochondrial CIV assembly protein Coa5/Pet191 [Andalucia godoyi]|eukprot:ANDGO_08800.mRNA.1 mitochondrial CIV assembly protein Coa5/Pet191